MNKLLSIAIACAAVGLVPASSMAMPVGTTFNASLDFGDAYGFPHVIIPSTRYDTDNFWVVEFDPAGHSYRILDGDKSHRASTCSDEWLYDGTPEFELDQPAEAGDCE